MKKFFYGLGILLIILTILGISAASFVEWRLMPNGEFAEREAPAAPDYKNNAFWVSHINKADTSDLIPDEVDVSNDLSDKPANVFFVHSTGYVGPGGWNSTMALENSETQSLEYMLSSMASAFNGCCEIYAPKYRQAHLAAFGEADQSSSFAALDLAYTDVERAFDFFIKNINQGRPYMIVAHSQGSLHALRLIANKIDRTPLRKKLVAAYTIGYWIPKDTFGRTLHNIGLCESAEQTQCIVTYDTYGEGGAMATGLRHWYPEGWETTGISDTACVNPLSWKIDTQRASAQLHKGAYPVVFKREFLHMLLNKNAMFKFESLPALTPTLTWAQCDESGMLHVAEQHDNAFSNHLDNKDKSYHVLDFSLFYGNLRENAIVRTQAFNNKSMQ